MSWVLLIWHFTARCTSCQYKSTKGIRYY